jgi:hypothetical protein
MSLVFDREVLRAACSSSGGGFMPIRFAKKNGMIGPSDSQFSGFFWHYETGLDGKASSS